MMSPRSFGVGGVPAMGRRTLLKGMLGAGALAGLSACGSDSGGGGGGGQVTLGSNWSDDVPK
jgi:multiple sugar transport system substrate-binding protein